MSSLFHPVSSILEKLLKSDDVDVRYMCLRDLAGELNTLIQQQLATQPLHPSTSAGIASATSTNSAGTVSSISAPVTNLPPISHLSPLDATTQQRLCKGLLAQFMCTQGEIHEAAIRCIPGLLYSVGDGSLLPLIDSLLLHTFDPKTALPPVHLDSEEMADEREKEARLESLRMKVMNTIKVIWKELINEEARSKVAKKIIPPVIKIILHTTEKGKTKSAEPPVDTALFALPCPYLSNASLGDFAAFLHSLLIAHPKSVLPYHSSLLTLFHSLLLFPSTGLLKVTLECITSVSSHLTPELQQTLIDHLLTSWSDFQRQKRETAFFQGMAILIKSTGNEFQPYISKLLPLIHLLIVDEKERYDEHEDEKESALLCLESLIRHSSMALLPDLNLIMPIIQSAVKYDPNFVGDHDTGAASSNQFDESTNDMKDDGNGGDEDYLGGGSEDEDLGENDADAIANEYVDHDGDDAEVDEDDQSWKVRRGGTRCIHALLTVIIIGSGSASDQQQQAHEAALPRLFIHTHGVTYRPKLQEVAVSLGQLLLTRLTERTDYIQVELLTHYRELLNWVTRKGTSTIDQFITSGELTLQTQLIRLLSSPIKSKPSTSTITRFDHVTSLLSAAFRHLPPTVWQEGKSNLYQFMTTRTNEAVNLFPTTHSLAPSFVHLVNSMKSIWERVPDQFGGWSAELKEWTQILSRWLTSIHESSTPSQTPVTQSCLRALSTLVYVIRFNAPTFRTILDENVQTNHVFVHYATNVEAALESITRTERLKPPPPTGPTPIWLDDAAAWSLVEMVQQSVAPILKNAHLDRSLLSQAVTLITTMDRSIYELVFTHPASFTPALLASTQQAIQQTNDSVLEVTLRLLDHSHTRATACECLVDLLHSAPLTPSQISRLTLLVQQIKSFLAQRDRTLLRTTLLFLHRLLIRVLTSESERQLIVTNEMGLTLQQLIPSLLGLLSEAGDSYQVEQGASLILLANLLQLFTLTVTALPTIQQAIIQQISPVLVTYLQSRKADDMLIQFAIQTVYVAMAIGLNDQQRQEWIAATRTQAEEVKEEEMRGSLTSGLIAFLLSSYCVPSSPYADLGVKFAPFTSYRHESAVAQIDQQILVEQQVANNPQAPIGKRLVAFNILGSLINLRASLPNTRLYSEVLQQAIQQYQPISSDPSHIIALTPLQIGSSQMLGHAAESFTPEYIQILVDYSRQAQNDVSHLNLHQALKRCSWYSGVTFGISTTFEKQEDIFQTVIWNSSSAVAYVSIEQQVAVLLDLSRIDGKRVQQTIEQRYRGAPFDPIRVKEHQIYALFLQRFLEQHHDLAQRWQLIPFVSDGDVMEATTCSLLAMTLDMWKNEDLDVLKQAAALLRTAALVQPKIIHTWLSMILNAIQPFLVKQARYVQSVQIGPSKKLVDTAVELRQSLWETIEQLLTISHLPHPRKSEDELDPDQMKELNRKFYDLLQAGLQDESHEILLRVYALLPTFLQTCPFDLKQYHTIVQAVLKTLHTPPPPQGVREELLAHEEVIQTSSRAALICLESLKQIRTWISHHPNDQHELSQLIQQLHTTVEQQQKQQDKQQKEMAL